MKIIRAISRRIEGCAKTVEYTGIEWLNINQYYWVRHAYEQYGLKNEKIWYAIAKGYLTDNQETEQNKKILNLLNKKLNEKKIEKGNAAKLFNMIYYNTSSDELQKQVVKVTIERKVVVQFKKVVISG